MVPLLVMLALAGSHKKAPAPKAEPPKTEAPKAIPPPSILLRETMGSDFQSRELTIVLNADGTGTATYAPWHGIKQSSSQPNEVRKLTAEQAKALWARLEGTAWWKLDGVYVNHRSGSHGPLYDYELSDGKRYAKFGATGSAESSMWSVENAVLVTTSDVGLSWNP